MGNYYEGSFCLKLKNNLPTHLTKLLKDLQTRNWNEDITIPDSYKDRAEDINGYWKEFQFEFGTLYKYEYGEYDVDHTYEKTYLKEIKAEDKSIPTKSGYYLKIKVCSKNMKKGHLNVC